MTVIPVGEYTKNRPWYDKSFSMPNIPRGSGGLLMALRRILTEMHDGVSFSTIIQFDGSNSRLTLDQLCVILRPTHLVNKTQEGWELSDASLRYLQSGDELYLAAVFCANIKFVAEILFYLDESPRKVGELHDIAVREYYLPWKTNAAINLRLKWLIELGLVDFQEKTRHYSVTSIGREFLNNIEVTDSAQILTDHDETVGEIEVPVSDSVIKYCERQSKNLSKRKMTIRSNDMPDNIDVDAVCVLHTKFLFVLELLNELAQQNWTRKELAAMAQKFYGFKRENVHQIEKRIDILAAAGLLRKVRVSPNMPLNRFVVTARGRKLLKLVPLQAPQIQSVWDLTRR